MFSGGWLWSVVLDKRRQHLPARVLPQGCLRQVYTYVTPFYLCYLSTYVTLFYLCYPFLSSLCVCVVFNREVGWNVSGHGQLCVRTALCLIPSPGCLPLSFLCVSPSPPPILHPIPLLIHRNDCSEASESSNSMPPSGSGAGGGGGSKKLYIDKYSRQRLRGEPRGAAALAAQKTRYHHLYYIYIYMSYC